MERGKAIMTWAAPAAWHEAIRDFAKKERISRFPWLHGFIAFAAIAAYFVWEWLDADTAKRASVPELLVVIGAVFAVMIGLAWTYVRFSREGNTTIHENGIAHGSRIRRRWIPWEQIEYFYTDEDSVGSHVFRSLNWQEHGLAEETCTIVPEGVDLHAVVGHLLENNVEQDVAPNI